MAATEDAVAGQPTAYGSASNEAEAARVERLALALVGKPPPWAAECLARASPALGVLTAGCRVAWPWLLQAGQGVWAAYRQLPKTVARGLGGLGMCFFGGRYAVSIAAIEAFRSMGGSQVYMYFKTLAEQAQAVWEAHVADEEKDEDADGVVDVQQVGPGQLATRKLALVLRTIDPEALSQALGGLWTAYMGVLAVLKFKFAQTVAFAHSIGESLRPTMAKVMAPTLVAMTPPEYRKWISPGINFLCKAIASFVAWKIQKLTSTVQSGFCGGMIASTALLALLRERKVIEFTDDQTFVDEVLGWSIGACGIYVQLFKGGPVPYFMSPLLWPLDIVERLLQWNVTWMSTPESKEAVFSK